jgi:predicted DCC family thiol-disulfide oxidoreductase YuxK
MQTEAQRPELVFYDGYCALCHATVKFILSNDRTGNAFRFAPLQGVTFDSRAPSARRTTVGDSIVVLTSDNKLLSRSEGILHILRHLGGGWKKFAAILGVIPLPLRDAGYDLIARFRYRVFGRRSNFCPTIPTDLLKRFEP